MQILRVESADTTRSIKFFGTSDGPERRAEEKNMSWFFVKNDCLSGGLHDGFEVADALGDADEGVAHVLLILEADGTLVAHFAQQLDEEGEVDDASAQLDGFALFRRSGNVLEMNVEDADRKSVV